MDNQKRMILSLDDFGINPETNKKFLEIIRTGKINRVSVMTNGYILENEVKELLLSGIKIDIHLDLQDSINEKRKIKEGFLKRGLVFLWKYISGTFSTEKIGELWEKQIQDFIRIFGQNPDGLNSHQYIHFFPPYFKKAIQLSKKYEIPFIRLGRKSSTEKTPVSLILNILRKLNSSTIKNNFFSTSERLISFDWINNFQKIQQEINTEKESVEIVFHPERNEEYIFLKNNF